MVLDPVDTGVDLAERRYKYRARYYSSEEFRVV